MQTYLIAGLGNPGAEYADTRHNIGFRVVDRMASDAGIKFSSGRYADTARVTHRGRALLLIKPTTFMNLSGKAVAYWLQQARVETGNLLVIVDEIALPFGKLRLGPKGSDGGHNGLKSIQESIQTTAYPRLRFGIGGDFPKGGQIDYVLGKWKPLELQTLDERTALAADAVRDFAFTGLERAMNRYNTL